MNTILHWRFDMPLKSLRQIMKSVRRTTNQVGDNTVVSSGTIAGTYVTSAYADVTFAKSA